MLEELNAVTEQYGRLCEELDLYIIKLLDLVKQQLEVEGLIDDSLIQKMIEAFAIREGLNDD